MGNPKKSSKRATQASAWKGKKRGEPLDLPSGNTALVRAVGMQTFMQQGYIPNSLMSTVQEAITKGKAPDLSKVEVTPQALQEMAEMMDRVCVYCIVEPKVLPVPADEDERDEESLYIDEVDLADKTFIFQFAVGGTRDLEKFREGLPEGVGALPASEDAEDSPE